MTTKRYTLIDTPDGCTIVCTRTGLVRYQVSEKFRISAEFDVKILNGELQPEWHGDVLIWIPAGES